MVATLIVVSGILLYVLSVISLFRTCCYSTHSVRGFRLMRRTVERDCLPLRRKDLRGADVGPRVFFSYGMEGGFEALF